jgi:LmbE family N-acetylglucosaminyl deacetylase
LRVLVIGAHPDDIEFGCGGTLIELSQKKFKITMYVATKGEVGGSKNVRMREQEHSAKIIGAQLIWGGFRDTKLLNNKELIDEIEKVIKKILPDFVFVNFYDDTHQDHVSLSKATITAARYINNLLFYETPTSRNFYPKIFVDIGKVMNKKLLLLRTHISQVDKTRVENLSIIESAKSTAIFRGYQARVKYAEGFDSERFLLNILCKG